MAARRRFCTPPGSPAATRSRCCCAARGAARRSGPSRTVEESLGKSEALGIKIVIDEKPGAARYRAAADPAQDRAFLVVRSPADAGDACGHIEASGISGWRHCRCHRERRSPATCRPIHHMVFGLAYLRDMNFVTQPGVELYKSIAAEIHAEAQRAGDITRTSAWRAMGASPCQAAWRGRMTLYFEDLDVPVDGRSNTAPRIYAQLLRALAAERRVEYGELTFFGDLRVPSCRPQDADGARRRGRCIPARPVDAGRRLRRPRHESFVPTRWSSATGAASRPS